jgi:hypothetical protein
VGPPSLRGMHHFVFLFLILQEGNIPAVFYKLCVGARVIPIKVNLEMHRCYFKDIQYPWLVVVDYNRLEQVRSRHTAFQNAKDYIIWAVQVLHCGPHLSYFHLSFIIYQVSGELRADSVYTSWVNALSSSCYGQRHPIKHVNVCAP